MAKIPLAIICRLKVMVRGGGGSWLGMGLNVYYIIYDLHHGTGDVSQNRV